MKKVLLVLALFACAITKNVSHVTVGGGRLSGGGSHSAERTIFGTPKPFDPAMMQDFVDNVAGR